MAHLCFTEYFFPRQRSIVFAFAGDSTITRFSDIYFPPTLRLHIKPEIFTNTKYIFFFCQTCVEKRLVIHYIWIVIYCQLFSLKDHDFLTISQLSNMSSALEANIAPSWIKRWHPLVCEIMGEPGTAYTSLPCSSA